MPLSQRESLAQQSHKCFLCLKSGHSVKNCNLKAGCLCCGKKHHISRKMRQITVSQNEESPAVEKKTEVSAEVDQALSNLSSTPDLMLQTFKVIIRGNGKKRVARAIIDTASQRSYLLRRTMNPRIVNICNTFYLEGKIQEYANTMYILSIYQVCT
ncbi:hypothetical protein X975_23902, partial [Stegodyphus mimosarum]